MQITCGDGVIGPPGLDTPHFPGQGGFHVPTAPGTHSPKQSWEGSFWGHEEPPLTSEHMGKTEDGPAGGLSAPHRL